jgi:predicted secreted protein
MDIPTSLNLEVGETYRLILPGLATAGYQWTYEITQSGDSVIDVATVLSETSNDESAQPAIGSSRNEIFEIRALRRGQAKLWFKQGRSWERDQPPLKEYQIEIVIQ